MSPAIRVAARAAAIVLPAAGAALGAAAPWSVLWGGAGWMVFLLAVLAGWGHLVARAARLEVDLGLRVAWGAAALLAVGGVLLAGGVLDRNGFLLLFTIGALGYVWRQVTLAEPALVALVRDLRRGVAADPHAAAFWALIGALALLNVLGGVVHLRGNTYDDDVAYTPFVRRLLDVGDLDEPFSFRRISAFGGQTVLSAMAAVRGTLTNIYLVDQGLFQLITVLLLVGFVRGRQIDRFIGGLTVLVMLLLPEGAINTGSYWSGVAMFLALYRTLAHVEGPAHAQFAIAGIVAAATCSLRQNYLPVAAGFLGLVLLFRLRRPLLASLRADRDAWIGALAGGLLGLVPYLIASWRSNETFLYPFQLGTFNPSIQMTPTVWTGWQELQFFVKVLLEPDPLRIAVPLLPILLLCRDRRRGLPLIAFTIAAVLGFVLLVHSFTLSDAKNLWRYAFGYVAVLTIALALDATRDAGDEGAGAASPAKPMLPVIGRFWILACLIAQLASTGKSVARKYNTIGAELGAGHRTHAREDTDLALPLLYGALQASAPAGARVAVLLDEPFYLDFARNDIINLDIPGYASWKPGMPYFRGAEPVAAYFRSHGVRYLAFVRGTHSRYFFRREFWVARLLVDTELWRIMGAYVVDTLDNFAALAERYPKLFDRDGLVMLDLGAAR